MTIPYTVQRNDIYYFNYRIPNSDIVFKKSLRTDSARLCKQFIKRIISEIKRRMAEVTQEKLSHLVDEILRYEAAYTANHADAILKPTSQAHKDLAQIYTTVRNDIEDENAQIDGYGKELPVPTFKDWITTRMTTHGYSNNRYNQILLNNQDRLMAATDDLTPCFTLWGEQLKNITDIALQFSQYIQNNDFSNAQKLSDTFKDMYSHLLPEHLRNEPIPVISPITPKDDAAALTSDKPTFNELWAEWEPTWIQKHDQRYRNERRKVYRWATYFIGDKPIDLINKKTIGSMFGTFANFPKQSTGTPYFGMTTEQLVEVADSDILTEDEKQGANLNNIWKHLNAFFGWCVEEEYLEERPGIKYELPDNERRGYFSYTQTRKLIDYARQDLSNADNWAALLQIYSGARNAEIQQLRNEDIIKDEDTDVWYIRITENAGSVKTKDSNRKVPVHQGLLDIGFIEWYLKQTNERLFRKGLNLTLWYNEAKAALSIPNTDIDGLPLTMYSCRHRMNTSLVEVLIPDLMVKVIIGHSNRDNGMTAHYTHSFSMDKIKAAIDKVIY